jgi:hypothetical protein
VGSACPGQGGGQRGWGITGLPGGGWVGGWVGCARLNATVRSGREGRGSSYTRGASGLVCVGIGVKASRMSVPFILEEVEAPPNGDGRSAHSC